MRGADRSAESRISVQQEGIAYATPDSLGDVIFSSRARTGRRNVEIKRRHKIYPTHSRSGESKGASYLATSLRVSIAVSDTRFANSIPNSGRSSIFGYRCKSDIGIFG